MTLSQLGVVFLGTGRPKGSKDLKDRKQLNAEGRKALVERYRSALEAGEFLTQAQLGEEFGISQTAASKILREEGVKAPHWFLRDASEAVVDPTADQFKTPVPYEEGKGKGFLTTAPSKRARIVIERLNP